MTFKNLQKLLLFYCLRFDENESITDGVVLTDPYTIDVKHATAWRMEKESDGNYGDRILIE